ncbi:MAG: hypothetical protein GXP55_13450 [Deltaproteobacteria bacterium]|nr:hypothetical protein [Deltaproteobacteria bacterium]
MSSDSTLSAHAHEFSIELDDVEAAPKDWSFPIRRAWLEGVLAGSELSAPGADTPDGVFDVRLSRVDDDVYAETRVRATVLAECARCLEDALLDVDVRGRTLLTREPIPEELADDEVGPDSALREALEGDKLVFDSSVREQLLLECPMKPLCRPDCPGIEVPEHVRGPQLLHPDGSGQEVDPRLSPLMNIQQKLAEGKE